MIPSARTQVRWYTAIISALAAILLAVNGIEWPAAGLFVLSAMALWATIKSDWGDRP